MGRCLIVANQTLGGESLDRAVRDCISRDVSVFYVVVPRLKVKDELNTWRGLGVYTGVHPDQISSLRERAERGHEGAVAEARRRARQRLDQMIDKIKTAGGQADGKVGLTIQWRPRKRCWSATVPSTRSSSRHCPPGSRAG
jgi:hypothetical protein